MNSLILCEGYTDAILLSYYLGRTCGWEYTKKSPSGINIQVDKTHGESVEWYRRGGDFLLICAVGSKDNFGKFFDARIAEPLLRSEAFSKIVLVIDRDDETVKEITDRIREEIPLAAYSARNNKWVRHEYRNGYQELRELDFLLLIIPQKQQGALETLLLSAISEDPYDKNIVDKSRDYVDGIAPEASRYLGKRRLVLKAYLGVTWAIQYPQKVFYLIFRHHGNLECRSR